jgi:D-alanine-D-alanine ligase
LRHIEYPAFIKPLQLESSEGISQYSFAPTEKDALSRMKYVHERLGVDAIIEEYIEGRELYVSILGNEKLTVMPIRELLFREVPEGEPKFATFKAKWSEDYRKRWGISSDYAQGLDPALEARILEACKRIYRHLKMRSYGRIDLRVKANGEIYFIEANPNPSIAADEDFALSAAKAGIPYEELIAKILSLSS